jgi:hypothetical protein
VPQKLSLWRRTLRHVARAIAVAYLVGLWVTSVGFRVPHRFMPRTASYFLDIAGLFTTAANRAIQYRVEAWVCADRRWQELDYRAYFPLHADDQESRFHAIMDGFRWDPETMETLDDFLVDHHNSGLAGGHPQTPGRRTADGLAGLIGGVRYVALRVPLPKPGDHLERYRKWPLDGYPEAYRHVVYRTDRQWIDARCHSSDAPDSSEVEKPDTNGTRSKSEERRGPGEL